MLVSSQVVYPEARAALAAATRASRIDESTQADAVATLEDRYGDAVHLASALHLEGDGILLATWGNAFNTAARATGQLIANDTG